MMTNICSEKLADSRDFYSKLFHFAINYDSAWFVHLISKDKQLELGIIDIHREIVPKESRKQPTGTYITFVVDNVDDVFKVAKANSYEIVQGPENTFYSQKQ